MLQRLYERFDTAEERISYRLWNASSVDTTKALVEKIAIEGGIALAIGVVIGAGIFSAAVVLEEPTGIVPTFGGCVGAAFTHIACNFGRSDDYTQSDAAE